MTALAQRWQNLFTWFKQKVLSGTEHKSAHTRAALLFYAIFFTCSIFANAFAITFYLSFNLGKQYVAAIPAVISLGHILGIWLSKRHLILGEICFMLFSALIYGIAAYWFGAAAGFQSFLLFFPYICFLALGTRRIIRVLIYFAVAIAFTLFCSTYFAEPALFRDLPPELVAFFARANLIIAFGVCIMFAFISQRRTELAEDALEAEYQRSEILLRNLLPNQIATRLKENPGAVIADHAHASILFADIVNFTSRAARLKPDDLVNFLNTVFQTFDELTEKHGLEKVKTIGDAYMVVAGLPEPRADHTRAMAELALDMQHACDQLGRDLNEGVALRVGMHCGPVIAGVIGRRKVFYDVWGDTVNTASRLESHGLPGHIQITSHTADLLKDQFVTEERGEIEVKGLGSIETHWLLARREPNAVQP